MKPSLTYKTYLWFSYKNSSLVYPGDCCPNSILLLLDKPARETVPGKKNTTQIWVTGTKTTDFNLVSHCIHLSVLSNKTKMVISSNPSFLCVKIFVYFVLWLKWFCFIIDERENVQKKTFMKWVNSHLVRTGNRISDLYVDLRDGKMLMKLLEVLSGERLVSLSDGKIRLVYLSIYGNNMKVFLLLHNQ